MDAKNKAIGYVRYAPGDRGLKPEQQRDAIEKWAAKHKVTIAKWEIDEGPADNVPVDDRTGLMNVLQDLRTRTASMLIATTRDRLAKDSIALAMIERLILREEGKLVYAKDKDEPTETEAKLKKKLIATFAEYERALMRVRTRAAVALKRERGEMTGRCPWGYHLAADGKTLEPDAREQDVLKVVRGMRSSGRKIREIVAALHEMGVVGRNGKPIGATRVFEMIQGGRKKPAEELPERG